MPKPPRIQYLDYEIIEADDVAILSDVEIPDHRLAMLVLFLLTCMAQGIKKCIIAGDLVATDQASLNSWLVTWVTEGDSDYENDLNIMQKILQIFLQWFEVIYIIEGNHDDRIARKTGGQVHLGMFLKGMPNTFYSRYSHLYIKTSNRGYIKVIHPANFSQDPVTLAQHLYNVERGPYWPEKFDKCHIVIAHCHRSQEGMSPDGVFECHSLGMMRDVTRTKYRAQKNTKHKQWDGGFMLVMGGYLYNLALRRTDWKRWLGDFYSASPFEQEVDGDLLNDAFTGLVAAA